MGNLKHWAVIPTTSESEFDDLEFGALQGFQDNSPSARIVKAIGDSTTAEIFDLYEKFCVPAEAKLSKKLPMFCAMSAQEHLLTIFVTDLRPMQTWSEMYELIKVYFSSKHPLLIGFGEPPRINSLLGVLLPNRLRFYPANAKGFEQMYSDIHMMNKTICRAQNMPQLILRRSNFSSAVGSNLRKGTIVIIAAMRLKIAALSTSGFIWLRKSVCGFYQ
jgi:hypothetical protein